MIREEEVFPIGRVGKPHGVRGEVTVQTDDDVIYDDGVTYLVLRVEGILVPFFIETLRYKSDAVALVKFEGMETAEAARELTGCEVLFPRALAPDDGDDEPSLASLIGFTAIDTATGDSLGHVAEIDDTTANILLVLDDGTPLPAALATAIDAERQTISMQLPEGLLACLRE